MSTGRPPDLNSVVFHGSAVLRKSDEPSTIFLLRPPKSWILKFDLIEAQNSQMMSAQCGIAVFMPALQIVLRCTAAGCAYNRAITRGQYTLRASSSFLFDTRVYYPDCFHESSGTCKAIVFNVVKRIYFCSLAIYRISPSRRRLTLGQPTIRYHCRGILFLLVHTHAPIRHK